ncbi:MAG: hypothetical protein JW787_16600, partial [Sedimentisphaerales bacterium]|nr:hypothetical protein [Sedimentisphaerales bacterium]
MAELDRDRDPNYVDRDRKEFKVVGKPNLPGKLSWAVATGVAKFGIDYVAPNMLEAKFMRSPYAHAKIKSYNKEKAMAIPGVVDIIAYDDPDIQNIQVSGGMSGPRHPFVTNEAHEENGIIGFIAVAENADICDEAF